MKIFLAAALLLALAVRSSHATTLASNQFLTTTENWNVISNTLQTYQPTFVGGGITYSDTGSLTWWFASPSTYSGTLTSAYNGVLSFTMSFPSFNNNGQPAISNVPDIMLVSQCGHSMQLFNAIKAGTTTSYSIVLNEDNWIDSRTNRAPNSFDFLGVLSNLAGIQIRGSFFTGSETTQLGPVTLTAGATTWYPCCTILGDVDMCSRPGSPYFNPSALNFYCEGSQKKLISVTSVSPNFGRRTGGTTVTVTGVNFGWAGSNPIVRIGGMPCQSTSNVIAAGSETMTVMGPTEESTLVCVTAPGTGSGLSVTVIAASGPNNSPFDVRLSLNSQGWMQYQTVSESCILNNNRGFAFAGADFAWTAHILSTATTTQSSYGAIAVDPNSGDIYVGGSLTSGTSATVELDAATITTQTKSTVACTETTGQCAVVLRFTRNGKFMWFVQITTASAGSTLTTAVTSISVDSSGSGSNPVVYFAGYRTVAGAPAAFTFISASGAVTTDAVTSVVGATTIFFGNMDNTGTLLAGIRNVNRCTYAAGVVVDCTAVSAESFDTKVFISTYRASTSAIIDQESQGNYPSFDYISGSPRDNGGVYLSGTINPAAGTTQVSYMGGINPLYIPTSPAPTDYAYLGATNTYSASFLVKLDNALNAQWIRVLGTASAGITAGTQHVTALESNNNAVFMSVTASVTAALTFYYDSCAFATQPNALGSTEQVCNHLNRVPGTNAHNTFTPGTDEVTTTVGSLSGGGNSGTLSLIACYSAAGVLTWHYEPVPASLFVGSWSFAVQALSFMRPFSGNAPVQGQPSGEVVYANGFYLYVGGSYTSSSSFTLGSMLLTFPAIATSGAFLLKLNVADGSFAWVANWAVSGHTLAITSLASEVSTGNVYIGGNALQTVATNVDLFQMATGSRTGVPGCNNVNGLSSCYLIPLSTNANTGFIAQITDAILDDNGNTVASQPGNTASTQPSIVWVKNFVTIPTGTATASSQTSSVAAVNAVHDLVVLGDYGAPTAANVFTFPNIPGTYGIAGETGYVLAYLNQ